MKTRANPRHVPANDFAAQWDSVGASALRAVDRVGKSGWLILGGEVEAFEKELAAFWGLRHAVGCGNGLDAIEIGLRGLGLKKGEKVLTTPLSAFATTLAVVRAGGVPVFADVDESGLLDLDLAQDALAKNPGIRFLLPVHLYGHALDLARLARLAKKADVLVLEDCAQAIGAKSRGRAVGSVGQAAAVSFYPTKNLGCLGDGGALLTGSSELRDKARSLRDYGQTAKYVHSQLGLNSRLDELHAAILRDALLPRLDSFLEKRREVARRYLSDIRNPAITIPPAPEGSASAWHLFPVLVEDRDGFLEHLRGAQIAAGVHYPLLIPDQPAFRGQPPKRLTALSRAARFAAQEVSLPIHPFLARADVDRVIERCNDWKGPCTR